MKKAKYRLVLSVTKAKDLGSCDQSWPWKKKSVVSSWWMQVHRPPSRFIIYKASFLAPSSFFTPPISSHWPWGEEGTQVSDAFSGSICLLMLTNIPSMQIIMSVFGYICVYCVLMCNPGSSGCVFVCKYLCWLCNYVWPCFSKGPFFEFFWSMNPGIIRHYKAL